MRLVESLFALMVLFGVARIARAGNLPVPSGKEQNSAELKVKAIYKDDYGKRAPANRMSLAAKLLAEGQKASGDDPATKYALLHQAAELAASAGDFDGVSAAVKLIGDAFSVKASLIEAEIWLKSPPTASTPDAAEAVARACADLLERLLIDERFDLVPRLASMGVSAAKKSHDSELGERIKSVERSSRELQAESTRYKAAQANLAGNPDGPEANLAVGRFLCFVRNDWDHGLPFLARGSDAAIKIVALKEAAKPTDPVQQMVIGDGWLAIDSKETKSELARRNIRSHIIAWYALAVANLTGMDQVKVDKRLADLRFQLVLSRAGDVGTAGAKITAAQKDSLLKQKAILIADSKGAKDAAGRREKLIDGAKITLQLDAVAGIAELDGIIKEAASDNDSDRACAALMVQGKFFGSLNNWTEAETRLSRIWKEYHDAGWGGWGCDAADLMAQHYLDMGQPESAVKYKLIIIDCRSAWGSHAGVASMWLADYYLSRGDKARAVILLKNVVEKFEDGGNKAKAKEKLRSLGETVPTEAAK